MRVILADDSPVQLAIANRVALELGFEIVSMHMDGGKAWDAIQLEKPDVAILDYIMPNMSGFEIATRVHELGLPTYVILATSMGQRGGAYAANPGVKGIIIKPYSMTLLEIALAGLYE